MEDSLLVTPTQPWGCRTYPFPHLFPLPGSLTNPDPPKSGPRLTATAGSDGVQSGRPIFDDFFQHLWPYIGNNTANVVFQMVKRLWLIRIDQRLYIASQK
ncbi:hypothetical protein TNCV_4596751 [Trichonephila clavipes]|uniref:Uncharacterized protein n=1 Tax=Trichonephila clavipes TaxID=2585209 RepID=A0A8X6WFA8_TRICX|nr:hypothetical protein TNCV_4596751 [Trichonephila clavipes]